MSYFALYETSTGRLKSLSSVEANPVPAGMTSIDLGTKPSMKADMWDEVTKAFITCPPKVFVDRLQDLVDKPRFKTFWQSLSVSQKSELRDGLIWLLGKARFRAEGESPEIE